MNSAILEQIRAARDILSRILIEAEPPTAEYWVVKASFWEPEGSHSSEEAFETLEDARLAQKEAFEAGAQTVWIDKRVVR